VRRPTGSEEVDPKQKLEPGVSGVALEKKPDQIRTSVRDDAVVAAVTRFAYRTIGHGIGRSLKDVLS
jgi:hypothetical protein